ncbi:ABC transporter permease [Nonomuraea typhae]|uniref:ABC transporter permease n=1 Tax=Nonomuraea typhae TaxID=2603600 RepID=UPI0012FBDF6C|nr:ABC transporter permease [Nonomuraea typhae]
MTVPVTTGFSWWLRDAWLLAGRNVRRILRAPHLLVMYALIQPVMFILLFAYVFGGAIPVPGGNYVQYLLPAVFVMIVLFTSTGAVGVGIAEDMERGVMDRFRSLPMTRSSVLLGRLLSEMLRNLLSIVVMVACGLVVGFRFHAHPGRILLGFGLLLLLGFAFSWVAAYIGLLAGSVEAAQGMGMVWVFPFVFVSSAFVPTASMPDWLRAYADHSPVTVMIDTLRAWFTGRDAGSAAVQALAWAIGLTLVFMTLSVARFRRTSR